MSTITLTTKGQLTLPKNVRNRLKIQSGDKREVYLQEDGSILLQPATVDIKELYGLLPKPSKPVSLEDGCRHPARCW